MQPMLAYLDQFMPALLVKVKRNPDGMAHINTTKIRSTNKVHEGMGTSIEVACPEGTRKAVGDEGRWGLRTINGNIQCTYP